jgi:hypothetical protein
VIGDGVHGIVVNGCTGESWSLDARERATVFRTAVEAAADACRSWRAAARKPRPRRWPRSARRRCRLRDRDGVAALVRHARPDEIMAHYTKDPRRDAAADPALQHPAPHGVGFTVEMVDRLADEPNVIGIKESSKDWGLLSSVIRARATASACSRVCELLRARRAVRRRGRLHRFRHARVRREVARVLSRGDDRRPRTARALQSDMERMLQAYFGLGTFPRASRRRSICSAARRADARSHPPARPGAARDAAQADGRRPASSRSVAASARA